MDAIVTAGGIPTEGDPLFAYTKGGYKALLDIAGKPMIQWVLDALNASAQVGRIVVVGLPPTTRLASLKTITLLEDHHGLLENLDAGVKEVLRLDPGAEVILAVSSDIPTLRAEMVDWFIQAIGESDHDVYYNVITREVMEKRFPTSHRTYLRLKDMRVCGGDINAVRASAVSTENPLWNKIISARKSPLTQASLVGFDTLVKILFHRLTLADAVTQVGQRIGIRGRALVCPYAEMGMDVDKPHQLRLILDNLAPHPVDALAEPA
jgi:GTP:adenosylcobinamide-phosphate guanylyltransferase